MVDIELEFSDHEVFPDSELVTDFSTYTSMETYLDEILKNNTHTCTHTHTCNLPGPDNAHTHTCYHTHTQIISTEEETESGEKSEPLLDKKKRPLGNREAVRKYREKKKAHTAHLEEEVQKLRLLNQQLLRKVQSQAVLEAEVARLRTLLFDFRVKIDSELGSFPYLKPCSGNFKERDCTVQPLNGDLNEQCETDMSCLDAPLGTSRTIDGGNSDTLRWEGICEIANLDCQALKLNGDLNQHSLSPEITLTTATCLMPKTTMSSSGNLTTLVSE